MAKRTEATAEQVRAYIWTSEALPLQQLINEALLARKIRFPKVRANASKKAKSPAQIPEVARV
jgi:hypothetical protein